MIRKTLNLFAVIKGMPSELPQGPKSSAQSAGIEVLVLTSKDYEGHGWIAQNNSDIYDLNDHKHTVGAWGQAIAYEYVGTCVFLSCLGTYITGGFCSYAR